MNWGWAGMRVTVLLLLCLGAVAANCDSEIYCRGPLLERIQTSGLFHDSKQFVDMPTSRSKADVLRSFAELAENATAAQLREFVSRNFHRAGYEMRIIAPRDWREHPRFLDGIQDPQLREFGATVHGKWRGLVRRFDRRRICGDCEASSLQLPYPFVVPGGRFREFYYWDSYWILEGLYVSEMCETAGGMIENMLVMIAEMGFIPNGARIYYANRSQPPLFAQMAQRYVEECVRTERERVEFVQRVLPLLEREHGFWMKERAAVIANHTLNVYRTEHWIPRPESFVEDKAAGKELDTELKRQVLYRNIASAAESGWDFSGRWLNGTEMSSMHTTSLVPADLNSVMYRNEHVLADFAALLNDTDRVDVYRRAAELRKQGIVALLQRDEEMLLWPDFDLQTMTPATRTFYISDMSPLWFIGFDETVIARVVREQHAFIHRHPGGVPASDVATGQQWDYPNVWAPIQQLLMAMYLRLDNGTRGVHYDTALHIAQRWINSTYCGFQLFGQFFEKYHAEHVGHPGGGGEYTVQEGFGWTNGVVLWTLDRFAADLKVPSACRRLKERVVARHVDSQAEPVEGRVSRTRIVTVCSNALLGLALFARIRK